MENTEIESIPPRQPSIYWRRLVRIGSSIAAAAALLLLLPLVSACGADSCEGNSSSCGSYALEGDNGIAVTHDGTTLTASTAVQSVNTFWFDDGAKFFTTIIGGWANEEGPGTFGTITARIVLFGPKDGKVSPGTYRFSADTDPLGGDEMTASLVLEHGASGIPWNQTSVSGNLVVEALEGEPKLEQLLIRFDGVFAGEDEDENIQESSLEGTIRFTKK